MNLLYSLLGLLYLFPTTITALAPPTRVLSPRQDIPDDSGPSYPNTSSKPSPSPSPTSSSSSSSSSSHSYSSSSSSSSTSTSTSSTSSTPTATPTPACDYSNPTGLIHPSPGSTLYFDPSSNDQLNFEILYCSGEYFKTRSISGDVWWNRKNNPNSGSGQILALQKKPDNRDAGISSSYRFNVSVFGSPDRFTDGEEWEVAFYEQATGYYYSYGYRISRVNVFVKAKPKNPEAPRTRVSEVMISE